MLKSWLFVTGILLAGTAYTQNFSITSIPDSLRSNVDVVKRYEEKIYEIKSPGKVISKERHVLTIMNSSGDEDAGYKTFYDQFTSINSISGTLYNAAGKEMRHMKKKDMDDYSAFDGFSLAYDGRLKKFDFNCKEYPYTVDFEEEDEINGFLDLSDWAPLTQEDMSVEYSKYVVIAPADYEVRYKLLNGAAKPTITEDKGRKIYTWEAKNIPPVKFEILGPSWREIVPYVMLAPSDFYAQGYSGNMSSWATYGKFIYQLIKGRDVLPVDIKNKVHELTDNLKDDKQKIFALYDFLQKNTRYVSIQLGIGGLQPFDAGYVAANKYGDCKALSNYMIALLKEAGITGKYVEIRAGKNAQPMQGDFPCFQSNHVITCVPMQRDSIWLECTSQTESPGYMGSFTGDRKAILVDESGGYVVNTPVYTSADNVQSRHVNAVIDEKGNLTADIYTNTKGIKQELAHYLMHEMDKDEREKYLNKMLNLPTYAVEKFEYKETKSIIPEMSEYLHISSSDYATLSGKRFFISPNLFNKSYYKFTDTVDRKYDIVTHESFKEMDSIQITIPSGYVPEAMPKNISLAGQFGKYSMDYKVEGNKILLYRYNEQSAGWYPKADFSGFAKFYNDIYKADRAKIVFIKKEG